MAPARQDVAAMEKALHAEKAGGHVRNAVVLFTALTYALLVPHDGHIVWLAYGVLGIGAIYTFYVSLFEPFTKYPVLVTSYATTFMDSLLIAIFVAATGGVASPFFLLWYVSIVGVAFRYDYRKTMFTSFLYVAFYLGVVALQGALVTHLTDVVIRAGFIILIAAEAGLLADESFLQTRAKIRSLHELEDAHQQLRDRDRAVTDMLQNLSHDIGTPLTPIRLQLQMLKSGDLGPVTEKQARALGIMERNAGLMAGLAQEALDAARIQSAGLRLETRVVDLALVAQDATESFGETAREKGIRLSCQTPQRSLVNADPQRIHQVLFNLITNAIRCTPEGGEVEVLLESDGQEARLHVRDTGRGIPPVEIRKLFQPFVQADDPGGKTHGKSGLGLYICRGIIAAHGGRIWAESEGIGQGATFAIALPRIMPPAAAGDPAAPASLSGGAASKAAWPN